MLSLQTGCTLYLCYLFKLALPFLSLQTRFTFVIPSNWLGAGRMVLGQLSVPGVLLIRVIVGQGPTALAVGARGGCLDIFSLIYHFSSFSLSLEDGLIKLKYRLKGPLSPKQPTNQPSNWLNFVVLSNWFQIGLKFVISSNRLYHCYPFKLAFHFLSLQTSFTFLIVPNWLHLRYPSKLASPLLSLQTSFTIVISSKWLYFCYPFKLVLPF